MSDQSIHSHSALDDVDERSLLEDADGDLFDVEQDFNPFADLDDDELDAMLAKAEGGFDATASARRRGSAAASWLLWASRTPVNPRCSTHASARRSPSSITRRADYASP